VVLAYNRKTFPDTVVLLKLIHNRWPHSVLGLVHETGLADQVHAMLGPREQDVSAIGRLEESNRS